MPGNDLSKPAVACYKPMQIEKAAALEKAQPPPPPSAKRKVQLEFEDDISDAPPQPAIALDQTLGDFAHTAGFPRPL